jgi:hypothetical protein
MIHNFTNFINESSASDTPYIFLDLNGVLLPYKKKEEDEHHEFFDDDTKWSDKGITVLNKICDEYSPKIVIISSYIREKSLSAIKKKLDEVGLDGDVVDVLDNVHGKKNRFGNVEEYVDSNDIKRYVIIDDHDHDLDEVPEVEPHLCSTKSKKGLTNKSLDVIREILNKDPN